LFVIMLIATLLVFTLSEAFRSLCCHIFLEEFIRMLAF